MTTPHALGRTAPPGLLFALRRSASLAGGPLQALALGAAPPLALLLLWSLSARHAWLPAQVLPAPSAVATTLLELAASGELLDNLMASLRRVLFGFAAGAGAGLLLGAAMGASATLRAYVFPLFKAIGQVPVLGWLPLLMLWVGIDEALKIIVIAKAAAVPVALNTLQGLREVPPGWNELARVLGLGRLQTWRHVLLPAALAPIFNGLRQGMTHAWLALVVVELLASSEGLGYLLVYGRQLFQMDVVLAAVVVVGATGFALDQLMAAAERQLTRWRPQVL